MEKANRIGGHIILALLLGGTLSLPGQPQSATSLLPSARPSDPKATSHLPARGFATLLPSVIFWAWERHEDLHFLDPRKVGVAFLAETIYVQPLRGVSSEDLRQRLVVRPRLQPLRVSPGTALIAVARIENSSALVPDADLQEEIAARISAMGVPGVGAVQIDFDATSSERPFYSALLQDVRRRLPASMPLSITALGSWCMGDPWLAHLPPGTIDEAVPMLFRMGTDASNISRFLRSEEDFRVAACRGSLGLSIDEPLSRDLLTNTLTPDSQRLREKRIYVFAPQAWTRTSAESVLKELKSWHTE